MIYMYIFNTIYSLFEISLFNNYLFQISHTYIYTDRLKKRNSFNLGLEKEGRTMILIVC